MFCSYCQKRRQNRHIGDGYRSKFCQACRRAGNETVKYCKFCSWSVSVDHPDCAHHIRIPSSDDNTDTDSDNTFDTDSDAGTADDDEPNDHNNSDDDEEEDEEVSYSPPIGSPRRSSYSSSRASIQLQRVKCSICDTWFDDKDELQTHDEENNSCCHQHGVCFPRRELYDHARENRHNRCFVGGCKSKYAKYDYSDDEEVEDHIWNEHTTRG